VKVRVDASPLFQTTFRGHALRFSAGGLVTVATGLVAKTFGPVVGGLFLALPSIFPIGLAMIEKIQNQQAGTGATGARARRAAIAEAAGASAGTFGLAAFALVMWLGLARLAPAVALALATAAWMLVAFASWAARRVRGAA
jgi:hypothetical protein